jgi:hypothetical protein
VGGLIGIIAGGLSLFDRYYPPSVEILDLTPAYISEPKIIAGAHSAIRGVGILLHVRATNRPVSITGLELTGKRCVSYGEFHGLIPVDGKSDAELEAEFGRQRPFQRVSFFGWPADRSGPISLTPWEESYVRFTFLEPGIGENVGLLIDQRYFGSQQRPSPMTRRYGFNVTEMFTLVPSAHTSWAAGHLRNEILDGVLAFRVLAGGSQIVVPTEVLRSPKRLDPGTWKKGDLAPLLAEQQPSLEVGPTENRSINCYAQTRRKASS